MASTARIGVFSALSIGIGGMVGGGIFAVTGLTIQLTKGAAPIAFILAGIVALLTSYSYLKLTLKYPSAGGTVEFLNRGFGPGVFTGAMNILLCFGYVVLLAVYAYAFAFWHHVFATGLILLLATVNALSADLVIRSENFFNLGKMALLAVFILAGLAMPMDWSRLSLEAYVPPLEILAGAMIIFLNYEGFELIANAGPDIKDPKKTLPIAYFGGIAIAMVLYVLITLVVLGHMDFAEVAEHSDYALSAAARNFMGTAGYIIVSIAALLATSSAINATFYGSGRLTYVIAKSGELPAELERSIRGQHLEGMVIFAALALVLVNFLPLTAIATMGSAGFLVVFLGVNLANLRLAQETESRVWISGTGALACAIALTALCWQIWKVPETRPHLWILVAMIALSLGLEVAYRAATKRQIHLGRGPTG
ncbi:MAG: APC family permease [Alphaproteobacteria bacterium]